MRKMKKVLIFVTLLAVLTSCFCMSAGAIKRHWAFKTDDFYDSKETYFDADPGNRIRFVATPKCSISSATATYNLYDCQWYGANLVPRSQTKPVNQQIRCWWGNTNPGRYSMTVQVHNNKYPSGLRATIEYPSAWLENFWGDLWS